MERLLRLILLALLFFPNLVFPSLVNAQESTFRFGGDVFGANENIRISNNITNDVFVAGNNVTIGGRVGGDVHAVGVNILVQHDVGGDIYVGGNSVNILGNVGQDILATGREVDLASETVNGNARIMGKSVILSSNILGNVLIGAEKATLNGVIQGDFSFSGKDLVFGQNAKVLGNMVIKGPIEIAVPASVASPERVTFILTHAKELPYGLDSAVHQLAQRAWPSFLPGAAVFVVVFLIGIIWLALMPDRSTMAYMVSRAKPFKSLFVGILGLSMFFGLVVVLAMSLFGIPLVPIALVLLVLAWIFGYLGGAYFIAARMVEAFGQRVESLGMQALALAVGLSIGWVLGLVPFIGWISQLALVFFGLGAMGLALIYKRAGSPYHQELHDRLKAE